MAGWDSMSEAERDEVREESYRAGHPNCEKCGVVLCLAGGYHGGCDAGAAVDVDGRGLYMCPPCAARAGVEGAREEAEIVQAGDELRTGPGGELCGVDIEELTRLLAARGLAIEPAVVGGEAGVRVVATERS
jgi:hypothetical protein